MGHLTTKDAYKSLTDRINWFTLGATESETLYKILQVLFTEKEAKWVSMLPIRPFSLKKAVKIWGTTELKAEKLLDRLCEKGLLVDSYYKGERRFVMPPPMIGFFEFALMRTRGDIDQKYLSELFHQYMNVEEDFIKNLFFGLDTPQARVFVQEPVLMTEQTNHILDYERASQILEDAEYIGVGTCYCRHKNLHLGIDCEIGAPLETCLTLGNIARSLSEHGGFARLIDKSEAMDILNMCYDHNLVQMGENVREDPAFMCNCCGCCCEALLAAKKFSPMHPMASSNYLPKISEDMCISCGKCAKVCPINAISMKELPVSSFAAAGEIGDGATSAIHAAGSGQASYENEKAPRARKRKQPVVDEDICLGCGICARNCAKKAIELQRRPVTIITPVTSTHRFVVEAIEKGTLQNLIFDNQAFANHRALAAVLGTILKLPPIKQALASKQFKSVYLDSLLASKK